MLRQAQHEAYRPAVLERLILSLSKDEARQASFRDALLQIPHRAK